MDRELELEILLSSEDGGDDFRRVLVELHCEENFDFWREVEEFRKLAEEEPESILEAATDIYEKYIKDGASHQVNLDFPHRIDIEECLSQDKVEENMFDECQDQIFCLMAMDSLPKYKAHQEQRQKEEIDFTVDIDLDEEEECETADEKVDGGDTGVEDHEDDGEGSRKVTSALEEIDLGEEAEQVVEVVEGDNDEVGVIAVEEKERSSLVEDIEELEQEQDENEDEVAVESKETTTEVNDCSNESTQEATEEPSQQCQEEEEVSTPVEQEDQEVVTSEVNIEEVEEVEEVKEEVNTTTGEVEEEEEKEEEEEVTEQDETSIHPSPESEESTPPQTSQQQVATAGPTPTPTPKPPPPVHRSSKPPTISRSSKPTLSSEPTTTTTTTTEEEEQRPSPKETPTPPQPQPQPKQTSADEPAAPKKSPRSTTKAKLPDYDKRCGLLGFGYNIVAGEVTQQLFEPQAFMIQPLMQQYSALTQAPATLLKFDSDLEYYITLVMDMGLETFVSGMLSEGCQISPLPTGIERIEGYRHLILKSNFVKTRVYIEREYEAGSGLEEGQGREKVLYTKPHLNAGKDVAYLQALSFSEAKDFYFQLIDSLGTHYISEVLMGETAELRWSVNQDFMLNQILEIEKNLRATFERWRSEDGFALSSHLTWKSQRLELHKQLQEAKKESSSGWGVLSGKSKQFDIDVLNGIEEKAFSTTTSEIEQPQLSFKLRPVAELFHHGRLKYNYQLAVIEYIRLRRRQACSEFEDGALVHLKCLQTDTFVRVSTKGELFADVFPSDIHRVKSAAFEIKQHSANGGFSLYSHLNKKWMSTSSSSTKFSFKSSLLPGLNNPETFFPVGSYLKIGVTFGKPRYLYVPSTDQGAHVLGTKSSISVDNPILINTHHVSNLKSEFCLVDYKGKMEAIM